MSLLYKPLEQIILGDLDKLITNSVSESRFIEYKEELPGDTGDEKREFLYDLTSFANSGGGDLIFGIPDIKEGKATTGRPRELAGIEIENTDALIRKYESMVRDNVQPRIYGVQSHVVPLPNLRYIYIIRVPRSVNSPHMVTLGNLHRFYIRNSAGKHLMEVSELRSAFMATSNMLERVRRYRQERLARISAGEGYVEIAPMCPEGEAPPFHQVVAHITPAVPSDTLLDIRIMRDHRGYLRSLGDYDNSGSNVSAVNFEGFITQSRYINSQPASSYVQLLREGSIEVVDTDLLYQVDGKRVLNAIFIERMLVEKLYQYLSALRLLEIQPPIVVGVSFLNVKGLEFVVSNSRLGRNRYIERHDLIIPEILLDAYPTNLYELAVLIRPILDAVYNSAGIDGAHFDKEGRWVCSEL